jgi:hypothetical protein
MNVLLVFHSWVYDDFKCFICVTNLVCLFVKFVF